MAIESFIDAITDESAPLSDAPFHEASDPSPRDVAEFARICLLMDEDRHREVLAAMVEQAEENLELDFTSIFRQCLRDGDDRIVQLGIEGLWEMEDRWLVMELVELLRSERGPQVRSAAALALGKFPLLAQEESCGPKTANWSTGC